RRRPTSHTAAGHASNATARTSHHGGAPAPARVWAVAAIMVLTPEAAPARSARDARRARAVVRAASTRRAYPRSADVPATCAADSKPTRVAWALVTVIAFVIGVVLLVVGLALSIALHELGHLLPAKKFGVRVGQYM